VWTELTPNAESYALVLQAWARNHDNDPDQAAGGGGSDGPRVLSMLQHWTQVAQQRDASTAATVAQSSVSLPMPFTMHDIKWISPNNDNNKSTRTAMARAATKQKY